MNQYAAMPSLHFGWNMLLGIAWARASSSWWMKAAGALMPLAMAFAVVATANHWIADVMIGGLVAAAGLAIQRTASWVVPTNPFARTYRAARRRLLESKPSARSPIDVDLTSHSSTDAGDGEPVSSDRRPLSTVGDRR